jgi:hypothetical protein
MKFYNLHKLNVTVGDQLVWSYDGRHIDPDEVDNQEPIIAINNEYITAKNKYNLEYDYDYTLNGLIYHSVYCTDDTHDLLSNSLGRMIKYEIP